MYGEVGKVGRVDYKVSLVVESYLVLLIVRLGCIVGFQLFRQYSFFQDMLVVCFFCILYFLCFSREFLECFYIGQLNIKIFQRLVIFWVILFIAVLGLVRLLSFGFVGLFFIQRVCVSQFFDVEIFVGSCFFREFFVGRIFRIYGFFRVDSVFSFYFFKRQLEYFGFLRFCFREIIVERKWYFLLDFEFNFSFLMLILRIISNCVFLFQFILCFF